MKLTPKEFEDLRSVAIILERYRLGSTAEQVALDAADVLNLRPLTTSYYNWLVSVVSNSRTERLRSEFGSVADCSWGPERRSGERRKIVGGRREEYRGEYCPERRKGRDDWGAGTRQGRRRVPQGGRREGERHA